MNTALFKKIIIKTLPVMAGYIVLGIGFGILLNAAGYGILWSFLMSVFIFAGSMQYVGISLITGCASLISVAIMTVMVNARHLFYGISMLGRYKGAGMKKPYLIHSLTDETYSLLCTDDVPENINSHKYYFLVSVLDHLYWVTGCVTGSIIGSSIKFDSSGIEFAMTALFVTVFIEQWLSTKEHIPAIIGVLATVISLLIFGKERFLIPSMVLIAAMLTVLRKPLSLKGKDNG